MTIVVAFRIAVSVLAHDLELWVYMTALAITNVLMMTLYLHYSRTRMLYLFAGF